MARILYNKNISASTEAALDAIKAKFSDEEYKKGEIVLSTIKDNEGIWGYNPNKTGETDSETEIGVYNFTSPDNIKMVMNGSAKSLTNVITEVEKVTATALVDRGNNILSAASAVGLTVTADGATIKAIKYPKDELTKNQYISGASTVIGALQALDSAVSGAEAKAKSLVESHSAFTAVKVGESTIAAANSASTLVFSAGNEYTNVTIEDNAVKVSVKVEDAEAKEGEEISEKKVVGLTLLQEFSGNVWDTFGKIQIVKLEEKDLEANVREAYKLVVGEASGDTPINIYKDASLYDVHIGKTDDKFKSGTEKEGDQYTATAPSDYNAEENNSYEKGTGDTSLDFVYIEESGLYHLVHVDIEQFLPESEFSSGLSVDNHIVKVKVGYEEPYLVVTENGIRTDGIDNAIAAKVQEIRNFSNVNGLTPENSGDTLTVASNAYVTIETANTDNKKTITVSPTVVSTNEDLKAESLTSGSLVDAKVIKDYADFAVSGAEAMAKSLVESHSAFTMVKVGETTIAAADSASSVTMKGDGYATVSIDSGVVKTSVTAVTNLSGICESGSLADAKAIKEYVDEIKPFKTVAVDRTEISLEPTDNGTLIITTGDGINIESAITEDKKTALKISSPAQNAFLTVKDGDSNSATAMSNAAEFSIISASAYLKTTVEQDGDNAKVVLTPNVINDIETFSGMTTASTTGSLVDAKTVQNVIVENENVVAAAFNDLNARLEAAESIIKGLQTTVATLTGGGITEISVTTSSTTTQIAASGIIYTCYPITIPSDADLVIVNIETAVDSTSSSYNGYYVDTTSMTQDKSVGVYFSKTSAANGNVFYVFKEDGTLLNARQMNTGQQTVYYPIAGVFTTFHA